MDGLSSGLPKVAMKTLPDNGFPGPVRMRFATNQVHRSGMNVGG